MGHALDAPSESPKYRASLAALSRLEGIKVPRVQRLYA